MSKPKRSYYGPFFWLAVVSFIVPVVVAVKAFEQVRVTTKPTPAPDASGVDHNLWDYLLKSYVENGLIDYDAMKRDHLFRTYVRQLSEANPDQLSSDEAKLAFYCNAYNAFVINGVITHKIQTSVMDYDVDGTGFFDLPEHLLSGKTLSLNELEHELIRKRFNEPRIHVALVCAAKSCPAIRAEAYDGKRLDTQLQDQSTQFANNPRYVAIEGGTLKLSPILSWYGDDWKTSGGYLKWIAELARDPSVKQAAESAMQGSVPVAFFDYDWTLNTPASTSGGAAAGKKAEFGSGTIPNG